jgi:dTDP-4-dehydrorhamnose reductase
MVTSTLVKLKAGKPFKVVEDWYNCPTQMDNFYDALNILVEKGGRGIYNCTGKTRLSRFEWAHEIADEFGMDGNLIMPMKSEELKLPAKRPDVLLDTGKIERATGIEIIGVRKGLKRMKESRIA